MNREPRRKGQITEYQNGHYFMYVTEWEEQQTEEQQTLDGGKTRRHREIEIFYVPIKMIISREDPIWSSTDPNQFKRALDLFFNDPTVFEGTSKIGELPE